MTALSLFLAGILVGSSCERGRAPSVVSRELPLSRDEFLRLQKNIDALSDLVEKKAGRQDALIRTVVIRDTVYGQGAGDRTPDEFTYRDERLWFWASLITDSVRYAISPVRIGLVLTRRGSTVHSVAYDLDDSTVLVEDSVSWITKRPLVSKSILVGCYYPTEPFVQGDLRFGRLGFTAQSSWKEGTLRARVGAYWRF